jgi:hypothetical protein
MGLIVNKTENCVIETLILLYLKLCGKKFTKLFFIYVI